MGGHTPAPCEPCPAPAASAFANQLWGCGSPVIPGNPWLHLGWDAEGLSPPTAAGCACWGLMGTSHQERLLLSIYQKQVRALYFNTVLSAWWKIDEGHWMGGGILAGASLRRVLGGQCGQDRCSVRLCFMVS